MRCATWLIACVAPLLAFLSVPPAAQEPQARTDITWKKSVLDRTFRSEGVAVADVNRDGKMDVLAGDVWYEAPDWKMHEIRKVGNYGSGEGGYSQSFACWAEDFNGDGQPDIAAIGASTGNIKLYLHAPGAASR